MPVGNATFSANFQLLSIPEDRRAPGKSAAHRFQHDDVAALDSAILHRGVERQRNRCRRRVGVPVDRDHDLFGRQAELLRGGVEDSRIGLVRNDPVDVVGRSGPAADSTSLSTSARLTTAWRNTSRPFMRSLPTVPVVDGPPSTNSRSLWRPSAWSLVARMPRSPSSAPQHERAGAVAEQDAGRAVLPVEDPAEGFGADHQRRSAVAASGASSRRRSAHRGSRCRPRARRTRCNR